MVSTINRTDDRILTGIIRRAGEALLTGWAAVTVTFFALRLTGGDPTASLLAQGLASVEQAEQIRAALNLDQPLLIQYGQYLFDLVQGRFGVSFYTGRPVLQTIREQLLPTVELAAASTLVMALFSLILGGTAAFREKKLSGRTAAWLADMLTTLPIALIGLLFLYLTSTLRQRFGGLSPSTGVLSLLLPSLVLGLSLSGPVARILKTSLLEVLKKPFIITARAYGLERRGRLLWYALRPALPPVIALSAIEIAYIFSGTVVTETIFARPGLGRLLVSSILQGDFPVAQGVITLAALFYTLTHFAADTLAMLLDPRRRSAS